MEGLQSVAWNCGEVREASGCFEHLKLSPSRYLNAVEALDVAVIGWLFRISVPIRLYHWFIMTRAAYYVKRVATCGCYSAAFHWIRR